MLANAFRKEKIIERIQIIKEVEKLSLFVEDMVSGKPNGLNTKLLQTIRYFSNVASYTINKQKSITFI